jgi:RNA polymerase sigma-70 factor, ECF subfamily
MAPLDDVFREAWPLVVAAIARLTRDLDLAEDCAQEAIERALLTWPGGVPDNPTGWLTTTARRIALDRLRREAALRRKLPLLIEPAGVDDAPGPTDPLRLVFTCCHPALARESQVALTLRLVCGVDVAAIAAVLLTGEAGIARRITRAKRKIAAARIPFRVPPDDELAARLDAVLTVVHLVHTAGHVGSRTELQDTDLTGRARGLARMLVRLLPDEPEPQALLGLILLTEARGPARTDSDGDLVLLADQYRADWDRPLIRRGLALTTAALRRGRSGRFALQAAVAGLHAVAPTWAETDWAQVVTTYDALMRAWPSPVVALNREAARSRLPGADLDAVLRRIDDLAPALAGYPYLPAARADILARLGRSEEAAAACTDALALTTNPVEQRFLAQRRTELATREPWQEVAQAPDRSSGGEPAGDGGDDDRGGDEVRQHQQRLRGRGRVHDHVRHEGQHGEHHGGADEGAARATGGAGEDHGEDQADQGEEGGQVGEPEHGDRRTGDVEADPGGAARRGDDRGGGAGDDGGDGARAEERSGRGDTRGGDDRRGHGDLRW